MSTSVSLNDVLSEDAVVQEELACIIACSESYELVQSVDAENNVLANIRCWKEPDHYKIMYVQRLNPDHEIKEYCLRNIRYDTRVIFSIHSVKRSAEENRENCTSQAIEKDFNTWTIFWRCKLDWSGYHITREYCE